MAVLETIKGTLSTAAETVSGVAQRIVEKNRTEAKLNRLRLVMKNESELINRAYIALGKQYYEMERKGKTDSIANEDKLFSVIENSKAKITKARVCYRNIIESQNEFIYSAAGEVSSDYNSEDVVDITVACSNESEYDSSPFPEAPKQDDEPLPDEEAEDTEAPADELF